MNLVGYSLADMLPAYPGKDETYINQVWQDTAHASDRFVKAYGLLGTTPCSTQYFNVRPGGFRSNGSDQPWPPDREKLNIFFFGGSTTMGYGLEDGDTIPAHFQRSLAAEGLECVVYNFGAGSYASRHLAMNFLDLVDQGIKPDYAIFLDGLNDSLFGLGHRVLVNLLDTLFQHERRRRRSSWARAILDFACNSFSERRKPEAFDTPVVRTVEEPEADAYLTDEGIANALALSAGRLPTDNISEVGVRLAERVWNGYLDSVSLIRAVADRRGIPTLFAWQPVPWFKTTPQQRIMERLYTVYRVTVFCSPVYHWLHNQGFPILQDDADFVNLSSVGHTLNGKLYADYVHYSSLFSEQIAKTLSNELLARKRFSVSA